MSERYTGINSEGVEFVPPFSTFAELDAAMQELRSDAQKARAAKQAKEATWVGSIDRIISELTGMLSSVPVNSLIEVSVVAGAMVVKSHGLKWLVRPDKFFAEDFDADANQRMCAEVPTALVALSDALRDRNATIKAGRDENVRLVSMIASLERANQALNGEIRDMRRGATNDDPRAEGVPAEVPEEESIMVGRWLVTGDGCEEVAVKVAEHAEITAERAIDKVVIKVQELEITELRGKASCMRRALDALLDE